MYDLLRQIDRMIKSLIREGFTGKQIAAALRDEGWGIDEVKVKLQEWGYYASSEAFLDLRSLFVSDTRQRKGDVTPVFDRNQAGSQLVIWLVPSGKQSEFNA